MEQSLTECEEPPSKPFLERVNGTFRHHYYPDVTDADWNDWRWQFRNRVTTIDELNAKLPIPAHEWEARREILRDFRMRITPYYLSVIDPFDPRDPVLRQIVPHLAQAALAAPLTPDLHPFGRQSHHILQL